MVDCVSCPPPQRQELGRPLPPLARHHAPARDLLLQSVHRPAPGSAHLEPRRDPRPQHHPFEIPHSSCCVWDRGGFSRRFLRVCRNRGKQARLSRHLSLRLSRIRLCSLGDVSEPQGDPMAHRVDRNADAIHHCALRPPHRRRLRHLRVHLHVSTRAPRLREEGSLLFSGRQNCGHDHLLHLRSSRHHLLRRTCAAAL